MPIYEYRCSSCGAELEKLRKISDPPLLECPECGKDTLVKLVSASSFRLKGSGWYETDFKTGKKKNGAGEEAGTSVDAASSTDAAGASAPDSAKGSTDVGSKTSNSSDAAKSSETKKESRKEAAKGSEGAGKSKPTPTA